MKKLLIFSLLATKCLAADTWLDIPYPMNRWGISVMGVKQSEEGKFKKASVEGIKLHDKIQGANAYFLNPESLQMDADVKLLKFDYFILPFVSIYGLIGTLDADVKFGLGKGYIEFDKTNNSIIDGIYEEIAGVVTETLPNNLVIKQSSSGEVYSGGILIAGEYRNIFSSLQYTYSRIVMDGDIATKSSEAASVRLGYTPYRSSDFSITPYLSGTYQKTDSILSGAIPGTNLDYKFNIELEKISPSVGVFTTIKDNITILLDYSFGDKECLALDIGYRF